MAQYQCETCGAVVVRFPSQTKRSGGRVFCSYACSAQRQQRIGVIAPCLECGKEVYRKPSEVRSDGRVFCSRTCSNRAQSQALRDHPELRGAGGPSVICQECGAAFTVKPHKVGKTRFCTRVCAHRWRFGKPAPARVFSDRTGAANGNYRGTTNKTTARDMARRGLGPANWRCMVCGWDIAVEVHHVLERRNGGRNEPENLAVLCPNHHRMAHLGLLTRQELQSRVLAVVAGQPGPPRPSDPPPPGRRGTARPAPAASPPGTTSRSG